MKDNKPNSGATAWDLRSRKNRVRLLKAGFRGKEIEELFIHIEGLVVVPGYPLEDKDSSPLSLPVNYPCQAAEVGA